MAILLSKCWSHQRSQVAGIWCLFPTLSSKSIVSKARRHGNRAGQRRALRALELPCVLIMELQFWEILGYVLIQKSVLRCQLKAMRIKGQRITKLLNCGGSDCSEIIPIEDPANKYWITAGGFSCPFTGFVKPDTKVFSRSVCFQWVTAAIILHL